MDFIAIDFETANSDLAYPCSLGITIVQNNQIHNCLSFLINPEGKFSPMNVKVHGITSEMVKDSPAFPDIWEKISYLFRHYPIVAHNASFDKTVLERTAHRYQIALPRLTYYCTMKLSQYNYPKASGYSLDALCSFLNIDLKNHHCCDDDSCAAANIMILIASDESNYIFTYQDANSRLNVESNQESIHKSQYEKLFEKPDYAPAQTNFDDGSTIKILDHKFCITGDIDGYDREALKQKIIDSGGKYSNSISKSTDYLVVGMENRNVVSDPKNAKSGKIIKAEHLKAEGIKINTISSYQFLKALEAMK